MKYCLNILSVSLFVLLNTNGFSQGFHTSSNKALKAYNEGLTAFDYLEYPTAENYFKEAVSIDKNFFEAYMMLGELMSNQQKFSLASNYYRTAVRIDSLFFKPVFFNLANAELMSGDYNNALIHFNVYLMQAGMSEKNRAIAAKNVLNCEFALTAIKNPVPFEPKSLGSSINTTDDEYWPSITADGQTIMFTRQPAQSHISTPFGQVQEDFYISYLSGTEWQKAINAGYPLNTKQNEGAQTLSSNGNYMFFTACDRPGGMGSCDIYFSSFSDGKWSEPSNLRSPVNSPSWETQPSISADGKVLFFSSSRKGGFGGKDIWYSTLNDKNLWNNPVNPGKNVNTVGDEMSPFIHFDGKTLYFASDGRPGMGGFDIYMTTMNSDSTWSEPRNLGYPINTYNDEMGLVIESNGKKAYFSSTRDKSNGKDIFCFDLYESARPNPVSYLKGKVFDKETGKLLKADYELINLSTNNVSIKSTTDGSGNFLVCLPSGYNYGINVNKSGYLFYSENFVLEGEHTVVEPYIKRISLSPIKVGEVIQLTNVFYEVDSWELKKESTLELATLINLLLDNKDLIIEIGGHTDSTGTAEYNLSLSEKRALSVVNYLMSKGISSTRLKYKGYGNTLPISDNVSSDGRRLNRRTEAKIIELKQK
jgi:outer membrane protein OmpA-like peptidoglycan-associated protein/Tol biopolymer transport system component